MTWKSWRHTADRKKFICVAGLILFIILALPTCLNLLFNVYGLTSAEMSAARMIIRMLVLPLLAIIFVIPLLIVTRQRLRDLGFSGLFVLLFPVLPISVLMLGPIRAMLFYGIDSSSLLLMPEMWLGAICLLFLITLPGTSGGGLPDNKIFSWVRNNTELQSHIEAASFRQFSGQVLITYIGISVLCYFLLKLFATNHLWFLYRVMNSLNWTISILLFMAILVLSVRRLNDLDYNKIVLLLFPGCLLPVIWLKNFLLLTLHAQRSPTLTIIAIVCLTVALLAYANLCLRNGQAKALS